MMMLNILAFAATVAATDTYYLDLVGEQGFSSIVSNKSPPYSVWETWTGTHEQEHLCHIFSKGTNAPSDEKEHVHNTLVRTITEDGTDVPIGANNPLLQYPMSYQSIATETSFTVWNPVCNKSFHSLGQIVTTTTPATTPPALNTIVCISDTCLTPCSPDMKLFTTTSGNTAWSVKNDTENGYISGCNRFVGGTTTPSSSSFQCLRQSCLRFDPYMNDDSEMNGLQTTAATAATSYPPNGVVSLSFHPKIFILLFVI